MIGSKEARRVARRAGNSRALTTIARIGFAASGLMHLLMGYLAIRIANHQGGESDQSGAFAQMAKLPGGTILVWVTVVGLTALALWLLLQAALGIGSASKKRWARSLVSFGKSVAYFTLASTALSMALRQPTDSATSARQASRTILSLPGGQLMLIVAGIIAAGIGGYLVVKGVRRKFHEDIEVPTGHAKTAIEVLGIAGYVAKGIAIVTLGILLIVAAIQVDPQDASGLDGALKALVALPFGEAILLVIGCGLMAYGLYSFARARLAKL
ncbi:DUF1206 domain-containing protein [Arthrobacter psychrolactophilus]